MGIFKKKQKNTTIKITKGMASKLRKLGSMGDSYEDVLIMLLKHHRN